MLAEDKINVRDVSRCAALSGCVRYVHLLKWATYAIVCVSASMARRVMSHGLVRQGDVQMRLRCYGSTGHCVHALGVQRLISFTPLACNV